MINLQIEPAYQKFFDEQLMLACAHEVIARERPGSEVELTLVVTGDETLAELNNQHLGISSPTDVLAFPADEFDPDDQMPYIGDVVLSLPRAQAQAETAGHPLQSELCLLVVHGILHLVGYDHDNEAKKTAMWKTQAEILAHMNIVIKQYPE